jgi:hypothetical protein
MTYLLKRGRGSLRRVAHLGAHDPLTGKVSFQPICSTPIDVNMASNVPWGCPTCKKCLRVARQM